MGLFSTLKNHHGKTLRSWKKLTAVDPGIMLFHHNCGDHYILRRSISNPSSTGSAGFHQVPLLLCHAQISLHVRGGMNRDIACNTLPTTTKRRQYHASPFVLLEKNKEDNEKEGFYDHVHNLFHPSKVDLFWKTHLEKVSKPEAREVVQYLDHTCPLGFDAYSHIDRDYASQDFDDYNEDEMYEDYGEDEGDYEEDEDHEYEYKEDEDYPNATHDDEDSLEFDHDDDDLMEFCRDVRNVYPQCLVVGRPMLDDDDNESADTNKNNNNNKKDDKVFRACGVDCVLLLEYTSFLKVKRAHSAILEIPEARLQEALDALTKRGFSIVVVEAALPTTKPKKQSNKKNKRRHPLENHHHPPILMSPRSLHPRLPSILTIGTMRNNVNQRISFLPTSTINQK